ncbi:hypothetical protein ACQ4PT_012568 [Festuca glaucescens]
MTPPAPVECRCSSRTTRTRWTGLLSGRPIENWAEEYVKIYYPSDNVVQDDAELQAWWKEVREVGHGDIKDQPWWPKMTTVQELVRSCATIIWIASALHAAR